MRRQVKKKNLLNGLMSSNNRKTVNKYWNEYKKNFGKLEEINDSVELLKIQENIVSKPKYNSESRMKRKVTPDFLKALENILQDEERKNKILGTNKQALTKQQIYELLKRQGFNVSYSTVNLEIRKIKQAGNECFIKQDYEYGDRLEYDCGEVKLLFKFRTLIKFLIINFYIYYNNIKNIKFL